MFFTPLFMIPAYRPDQGDKQRLRSRREPDHRKIRGPAPGVLELSARKRVYDRNIPSFSRFLRVAAHCIGTIINFTNLANDAQVPRTTVCEYLEIRFSRAAAILIPSQFTELDEPC
jgi:hypothetical protein